jgi:GNAT superfamily N-acetyltransferase
MIDPMEAPDPVPNVGGLPHAEHSREPPYRTAVRDIVEFERILADRIATRIEVLPFGIARLCPDLPHVYDASGVEVTRPVATETLLAVTESLYAGAGLRHRRIHTAVAQVDSSVGPALTSRGWSRDQWVYMTYDRRCSAGTAANGCVTVDFETWTRASPVFAADHESTRDSAVMADMEAYDRLLAARIDTRLVMTADATARCHVYRVGGIAQIENIYVLTHARGKGLGRALLASALDECREADLIFLVADADGWQRQWYARAGFTAVSTGWNWLRKPAADA